MRETKKLIRLLVCIYRRLISGILSLITKTEAVTNDNSSNVRLFLPKETLLELNSVVWIGTETELSKFLGLLESKTKTISNKIDQFFSMVSKFDSNTKLHKLRLTPFNEISKSEDNNYQSNGIDPSFLVSSSRYSLPSGLLKISFDWDSEITSNPVLYYDCGYGISEKYKVELCGVKNGRSTTLVFLPPFIFSLRLDPISEKGIFRIENLVAEEIRPVNKDNLLELQKQIFRVSPGYNIYLKSLELNISKQGSYQRWLEKEQANLKEPILESQLCKSRDILFSIIMPVYDPEPSFLKSAIESLIEQSYTNWQLCIVDDCSENPDIREMINYFSMNDSRIIVRYRTSRGHISQASNDALENVSGEFCILLDHDDLLPPYALSFLAREIELFPNTALIYSDEDKLYSGSTDLRGIVDCDSAGCRYDPYFKPEWDSELLLTQNYISHLGIYRTDILKKIGGFRLGYEGAQDWDLVLRFSEQIEEHQIRHIPHVLYHWRATPGSISLGIDNKSYAYDAGFKVIVDTLNRRNIDAEVLNNPLDKASYRIKYSPKNLPSPEIIIPTKDNLQFLKVCVNSILDTTCIENFNLTIVDNDSKKADTKEYLHSISKKAQVKILPYHGSFNYSAINNMAIANSNSNMIVLLNDDTEIINSEWLTELVSQAMRPEVGIVGARLLYADNTIQHAGIVLGIGGIANNAFQGFHVDSVGFQNRTRLTQQYSAVTGACMAFRKEIWQMVGGFDEINLPNSFNDVDFCLKVKKLGYKVIWTPFASLYHHESQSRGKIDCWNQNDKTNFKIESQYISNKWGDLLRNDPAYHPNFNREKSNFWLE